MRFISILIFGLAIVQGSSAQDVYTYTQTTTAYWNNVANWTCPAGSTCPPTTIPVGDTVKINGFCGMNPVLQITNNGTVIVNTGATLTMEEIGWFNNYGTLTIQQGAMCDNDDGGIYRLYNGSVLNVDGAMGIIDDFGGDLLIFSGSMVNVGPTGVLSYY